MHANGGTVPSSTDGKVEFFLMVHQAADGGIFAVLVLAKVHAVHDGTHDHWANLAEFIVDGHGGGGRCYVQPWTDGLVVEEGTHGSSKRFR